MLVPPCSAAATCARRQYDCIRPLMLSLSLALPLPLSLLLLLSLSSESSRGTNRALRCTDLIVEQEEVREEDPIRRQILISIQDRVQ